MKRIKLRLTEAARAFGYGIHVGNAIRHGRPISASAADATGGTGTRTSRDPVHR